METKTKVLLVLAVCLACSALSKGTPIARTQTLRCFCPSTETHFISPKLFLTIEILPKGPYCKNVEVIVTLKNGGKVCLEPSAHWVKKIINNYLNSGPLTISRPWRIGSVLKEH
ncbi:alveolar macrophage chemotactic factor-like [Pelodytes ibericus]